MNQIELALKIVPGDTDFPFRIVEQISGCEVAYEKISVSQGVEETSPGYARVTLTFLSKIISE